MEGSAEEVININKFLKEGWSNLKPVLPIASGGLHPGIVPKLIEYLGNDLIINFGGGLHGHPAGSAAGARACFQAVQSVMSKVPLKKYAQSHKELKKALEHWGKK
jgi:ribulose-bisphosphate carboxylase large chain